MLDGVNDSDIQAKELVRLLANIKCKINLIPFNPFPESGLKRSSAQRVHAFASILLDAGMVATVRKTRGDDIAAGYKYIFSSHLKDLLNKKRFKKLISEVISFKKVEDETYVNILKGIINSSKGYQNGNVSADGSNNNFENLFQKNFLISNKNKYYEEVLEKIENEGIDTNLKKFIFRDIFFVNYKGF